MGGTMTDAEPPPRPFNALWLVLVCILISVLEGYDVQAIGVAAPTLAPAMHMGQNQIGLAGSMAMVGLILAAAPAHRDRLHRQTPVGGAGHASVSLALAWTLPIIALGAASVLHLTHKTHTFDG